MRDWWRLCNFCRLICIWNDPPFTNEQKWSWIELWQHWWDLQIGQGASTRFLKKHDTDQWSCVGGVPLDGKFVTPDSRRIAPFIYPLLHRMIWVTLQRPPENVEEVNGIGWYGLVASAWKFSCYSEFRRGWVWISSFAFTMEVFGKGHQISLRGWLVCEDYEQFVTLNHLKPLWAPSVVTIKETLNVLARLVSRCSTWAYSVRKEAVIHY